MSIKKSEVPTQRIELTLELFNSPNNRRYISAIRIVGTTNVVKIFVSANLFLHISKRFYIFADVGKG